MGREVIQNCPRDLDIPHISQDDILCLNQPLMTKEVKDGVFQIVAFNASGRTGCNDDWRVAEFGSSGVSVPCSSIV
ncbi:hypothetical protein J1N35_040136 [Gossypium stocksii]|uniref:Uncharacterized protein n=1 Tax=Gossypium stocksii TaxID=47602 RepID=A0A9D3UDM1_9ROSI|nr:hypothetical protein J1N35_040136 [Gossypium stocksii]